MTDKIFVNQSSESLPWH